MTSTERRFLLRSRRAGSLALAIATPGIVCAQASPFLTGATALQTNILDQQRQIALARTFARELAERYGCAVDMAVHAPRHDPRNFHAHLLSTTREVTPDGLGEKTAIELSGTERTRRGLAGAADEFRNIRERWATLTNSALREAHVSARVSHLGRHAESGQATRSGEARESDSGLKRLERIQEEARANWLQTRQQQVVPSDGVHHAGENSPALESDGRPREVEHDATGPDLSL